MRLQARACHLNCLRDAPDSFVLADDAPLEQCLQVQQSIPLLAAWRVYRNPCAIRDDLRNHCSRNHRLFYKLIFLITRGRDILYEKYTRLRARFIQNAACFVGQAQIWQVLYREMYRCMQCLFGDGYMVMLLVEVTHTRQYCQRFLNRGFFYCDGA